MLKPRSDAVSDIAVRISEVRTMTVAKMKGQLKETTGKLTGDTGTQVEGTLEKGVAEVKRVVGGAADFDARGH
jgi:uncharacterized protein YjbJ (UPF0337 family)